MSLQKKSPVQLRSVVSSANGKILAIVGPTAVGKTGVALELAEKYPVEIICADSRTIYKGMDIGTAKPTAEERTRVPHHGLDLILPGEKYSVADFVNYAEEKIQEIWLRDRAVLIVGGSGMYVDALLFGYKFRDEPLDSEYVDDLSQDELLERARQLYPDHVDTIDVKNTRRLRQLVTKGPADTSDRRHLKYDVKIIGIDPGSENLQIRIENRTDAMLKQGFVQECKTLLGQYGNDCPALHTTGYAAVMRYIAHEIDETTMRAQMITDTKRLAKKQRTWFKRNSFIEWTINGEEALKIAVSYLRA
ncbi:MAG: tRNA dimethylallyltransferase [Patescibacteria group bacterium]|nr:tRNA dimethylallyltransferase [Patescibacteria group bacterium]